ncbi:hypothetical protein LYSHEL_10120 [Lysobacter helvus]|uniref:Uncharacterized protein n=2 Tax=Lysobacteraceae TaxID=32033 RepID=A0ABN6FQV6_9GAMM|nr:MULTISPECIES: hypothetical protein [Lysobacter]BCT91988.1 hypothetical protein LYSCAS_10120 [Lysobacter caseinilyticus]BCT95141.1 hypothetical protein LYSHEL_10120 [Lysobacter helvus]
MQDWGGVLVVVCALGAVFAIFRLQRRAKASAAIRNAASIAALANAQRFEARSRRWVNVVALLVLGIALVMLGWGAYVMTRTGTWIGAVVVMSTGIALLAWMLASIPRIVRNEPMLSMDARGLYCVNLGRIPWTEILAIAWTVRQVKNGELNQLELLLRKPARYLDGAPWRVRLLKRRWRTQQPRYGEFNLSMDSLDKAPAVIHAAVLHFREQVQPPLAMLWRAGMDDRQVDVMLEFAQRQADIEQALRSSDPAQVRDAMARVAVLEREGDAALEEAAVHAKRTQRKTWLWNAFVFALVLVALVIKVTH